MKEQSAHLRSKAHRDRPRYADASRPPPRDLSIRPEVVCLSSRRRSEAIEYPDRFEPDDLAPCRQAKHQVGVLMIRNARIESSGRLDCLAPKQHDADIRIVEVQPI